MNYSGIQLIKVDEDILQEMFELRVFEPEFPIIAVPITYQIKPQDFIGGLLLFTHGAIYIIDKKVQFPPTLFKKFHLLNLKIVTISQSSLEFIFNKNENSSEGGCCLEIKSNFSIQIAQIILQVFYELTFGIPSEQFFKVNLNEGVDPNFLENILSKINRPNNALRFRSIFLSHFYNVTSENLSSFYYLKSYDLNPTGDFVITNDFKPKNFAKAFGHAIAWDSTITNILFKEFKYPEFQDLLFSILQNSYGFKTLHFSDYKRGFKIEFENLIQAEIKKLSFQHNTSTFTSSFITQFISSNFHLDSLNLLDTVFNEKELTELFESICNSNSINSINTLYLSKTISRPFPFTSLGKLISLSQNLKTIAITSIDIDATKILHIICKEPLKNLTSLFLTKMQFRTIVDQEDEKASLHLPSNILHINVSGCFFTPSSLYFLFWLVTHEPLTLPIVFEANEVNLFNNSLFSLSQLDYDKVVPNIREFLWDSNMLNKDTSGHLFSFLYTQRRLQHLSLVKTRSNHASQILKQVVQLAVSIGLSGIDISFNTKSATVPTMVDKELFLQFIVALGQMNFLRRIGLAHSELGDDGLAVLKATIQNLPSLTEIAADGFAPETKEAFVAFWEAVAKHPSIRAADKPTTDFAGLRAKGAMASEELARSQTFAEIRKLNTISSTYQRTFALRSLADEGKVDDRTDLFELANRCEWVNNQAYRESLSCDESGTVWPNYLNECDEPETS